RLLGTQAMKTNLVLFAAVVAPMLAADFPHSVAIRGCTQEDAPALELYVTQQPYNGRGEPDKADLHIEIAWGDWSKMVGRDLDLVSLSRRGAEKQKHVVRAEHVVERAEPSWLKGTLRLNSVEVDHQIEGSYFFTDDAGN